MKRLYAVTLEAEIVVVAESRREAAQIATDSLNDLSSELSIFVSDLELTEETLPGSYDVDTLPWGTGESATEDMDMTIGDYLAVPK